MIRAAAVASQSSGKIRPTKTTTAKSGERLEHDTHVDASPTLTASPSPSPAYGIDVVDRVSACDGLRQLTLMKDHEVTL